MSNIEIELFDGTVLEFPQGTSQDVINKVAKQETMARRNDPNAGFGGGSTSGGGSGAGVDFSAGETAKDVALSAPAKFASGTAGLLSLPGLGADLGAWLAGKVTGREIDPAAAATIKAAIPGFGTMLQRQGGDAFETMSSATMGGSEYQPKTTPGKYVGSVAEMLPGVAFGGGVTSAVASGVGSEGGAQIAESLGFGETAQGVARVAGAFFTPFAVNTASKTVNAMFDRASKNPTLDTLQTAKQAAYKAVDDSGATFDASTMDDIFARAKVAAQQKSYVADVDAQTRAALTILERNAGKSTTIGELDKIRQGLSARYNADKSQAAILDMIDIIDDKIAALPDTDALMNAARVANSRYKKAELIDKAFADAELTTAGSGSGGNIQNKYRQAVTSIVKGKSAKYFSAEELGLMRKYIEGDLPQNLTRLIGKMSPSGNGLMMALNIGAIAANPMMAAITLGSAGAKTASDAIAVARGQGLRGALATGVMPPPTPSVLPSLARPIPGLLSQIEGAR
jgi:hypothetical protein